MKLPIQHSRSVLPSYLWISSIILCLLASCDMHKVSKVTVDNLNGTAIGLKIFANNAKYEFSNVPAMQKAEGQLDFTNIDKKAGHYILVLQQASGQIDTFTHGYFEYGELSNYMNITVEGSQLRLQITE
jgi:hypothetical protein